MIPSPLAAEEEPSVAPSFPTSWVGEWKGPCVVVRDGYARSGDQMTVTLTTFGAEPESMTGREGRVPTVASYALRSVQRATLTRSLPGS